MSEDSVKRAWQATADAPDAPSLEAVRAGADKFYRRIRLRNTVEYVACAVVIVVATVRFFTWEHILHKAGFAMLVAAAFFVAWQLHRRASAVAPEMAGTMPIYAFMRGQFVRQRDALKGIFWWYILPLLPGMGLVLVGNGLDPAIEAAGPPHWVGWLFGAVIIAVFFGIWWFNQRIANKLQRHIDEIDALAVDGQTP